MELKVHRPTLTDADLDFMIEVLSKEHHRLDVTVKMLEEDYEQLDRRSDINQLSNVEIIHTDFDDLKKKKQAIKRKLFTLWDERGILAGYIIRLRRILDGKASRGGRSSHWARTASDDVHRRWFMRKEKELEASL